MNVAFVLEDRQIAALLANLGRFAARPQSALTEIGAELKESTRVRFNAGVSPSGAKWQPLALATILRRARRSRGKRRGRTVSGSHQPLMDTRTHLFNSITYRVQADAVTVGVAPRWAAIHQFGGMAGRGRKVRIPARPFLGVSIADRREIVAILTRHALANATTSLGAT